MCGSVRHGRSRRDAEAGPQEAQEVAEACSGGLLKVFFLMKLFAYICICIYIYMYISIYVIICTCIRMYMYMYVYMYMSICLSVYLSVYIHTHIYICIYIYIHIVCTSYIVSCEFEWLRKLLRPYAASCVTRFIARTATVSIKVYRAFGVIRHRAFRFPSGSAPLGFRAALKERRMHWADSVQDG